LAGFAKLLHLQSIKVQVKNILKYMGFSFSQFSNLQDEFFW